VDYRPELLVPKIVEGRKDLGQPLWTLDFRPEEIPEVDFSRGIQPHRYARLRTGWQYTVFLKPELWEHLGSADAVNAALRALVDASRPPRGLRPTWEM
jgi:hypothetical protein